MIKSLSISIDVETPQTPLFYKKIENNLIWAGGNGIEKIVEILNSNRQKGIFYVNVYEYKLWGINEIKRILKFLDENEQSVQLHTHPIWIDEKRREFMYEYNSIEQENIIRFGKDIIEQAIGKKVTMHRAGGYGLNEDTLRACAANEIQIDSSIFFGHRHCRFIASNEYIKEKFGITEIPIERILINGKETKLDLDWMEEKDIINYIATHKVSNLMLHSYSLIEPDFSIGKYNQDKVDKLNSILLCINDPQPNNSIERKKYSGKNSLSKKQIIFVKKNPQIRIFKQAYALKKKYPDIELILISEIIDYNLFSKVFDKIIEYKTHHELKTLINKFNPYIYHVHAEPNAEPAIVIETAKVPVIYDVYDFSGLRYGIENLSEPEKSYEKYSIENSSAIVFKFEESILDYYRENGYIINKPTLTYLDYCIPEYFHWNLPLHDPITLVYAGVLNSSKLPKEKYGNNQYIDFINMIAPQGIGYQFYVNIWQQSNISDYADYIHFSKEFEYVKFNGSLEQPKLQETISRFHFGVSFHNFNKTNHNPIFGKTSIGNKLSTYLEAGLPILVSSNLEYNTKIIKDLEIGLGINLDDLVNLRAILKNVDYKKLKLNVNRVRNNEFNAIHNVDKLLNFYKMINGT